MAPRKPASTRGIKPEAPAVQIGSYAPTDEQQAAIDLFGSGKSFAIEAGAGTGKTSTLQFLAEAGNTRSGQYVAFNKSIVNEAGRKFPVHVRCNTAHSLAFKVKGREYAHRLQSTRMRSSELAARLGVDRLQMQFNVGGSPKTLSPSYLAGLVMRSIEKFCQTADPAPTMRHVPYIDGIDMPDAVGMRTYVHNNEVAEAILPAMHKAWGDLQYKNGQLPYRHSHYLKAWQLDDPRIEADYILFDEVQDADPVMADIVLHQSHAQIVLVGDSQQEIYGWRGAVNAFELFNLPDVTYLTQSFRFGNEVADVANIVLERLEAPLRLKGLDSKPGKVHYPDGFSERHGSPQPDAILTRTNASAVGTVMRLQAGQIEATLMGGGKEILAFARAARDLQERAWTGHPELACFNSWEEVGEYVGQDPQGSDLKLQYDLVEEFGVETIERALDRLPREGAGVVTVATAHKSKGREWDHVVLTGDFAPKVDKKTGEELKPGNEEQRLLYVAVTRARSELDITQVPQLAKGGKVKVS